ncbi:MAG: hypothetical protein JWM95_1293 [Gemmatimonadetes bacterium]|nr:hypothetical protein [Gemmatimonadota bacterium]
MVLAFIGAVSSVACHDFVTYPVAQRRAPNSHAKDTFENETGYGQWNTLSSDSYDARIDAWDGHANQNTRWSFHFPTVVMLHATGDVQQVPGLEDGDGINYGPKVRETPATKARLP